MNLTKTVRATITLDKKIKSAFLAADHTKQMSDRLQVRAPDQGVGKALPMELVERMAAGRIRRQSISLRAITTTA